MSYLILLLPRMKIWLNSILGASPTVHVMWGLAKVQENNVAYVIRRNVVHLKVYTTAQVKKWKWQDIPFQYLIQSSHTRMNLFSLPLIVTCLENILP